jgi:hypothetical protein
MCRECHREGAGSNLITSQVFAVGIFNLIGEDPDLSFDVADLKHCREVVLNGEVTCRIADSNQLKS